MGHRRAVSLFIAVMLLAQPTLADVIATRTGEKFTGTVANRDEVRAAPRAAETIGMLLNDSGEFLRFRVQDIEYVVLQEGDVEEVIDFQATSTKDARRGSSASAAVGEADQSALLMGLGFIAGAVGVAVKFGGPKCTIDESSVDCDEKSYNAGNYALMAGGGLLLILGLVEAQGKDTSKRDWSRSESGGPELLVTCDGGRARLDLGYKVSF